MLNDATGFNHIYIACGRTDLRKGIDGMVMVIKGEFGLNPFETGDIFLFCGSCSRMIKALVYEEDGFVLLTKRLLCGHFQWPRNTREMREIPEELYRNLMDGFAIEYRSTIKKIRPLYV